MCLQLQSAQKLFSAQKGVPRDDILTCMGPYHAMGRIEQPEEVATLIVFLSSDAASFITGINLPVDDGCLIGYWFNKETII